MKAGRSIVELAQELERQVNSKKDYVVATDHIRPEVVDKDVGLVLAEREHVGITNYAHGQLAETTGIPKKYYDRMRSEAPALLASNIDVWFKKYPQNRMVRTLDGRMRAMLSDRYRPLENFDLAEAILPIMADRKLDILSCELTETRLYIKAVDHQLMRDIPTGHKWGDGTHTIYDTLAPAVIVSNSEVGAGALQVQAGVYTRGCTNLATFAEKGMRKYHVGGRHDMGEQILSMLSDQTRKLTDAALWSQLRDVVAAAFDEAKFNASVDEIAGLAQQKIEGDPLQTVDLSAKTFGWTQDEKGSVLKHLIQNGDLTRYGLFNAITRTAEDLEDYDRASQFELMGGKIIELNKNEWRQLAEAA
jgi:hypothetical protein